MDERDERDESDGGLAESVAALRGELKKKSAGILKARKALDALAAKGALDELAVLDKTVKPLRDADLSALGLDDPKADLARRLAVLHERLKTKARLRVLGTLTRAAAEKGVEVVKLTEKPLTVRLAPFTVELDLDRGKALICYAREVVEEIALDSEKILAARERVADEIRKEAVESPRFFDMLFRAYRTVLIARGLPEGERVDLVDLLAPLALLRHEPSAWRKHDPAKAGAYPRYLLAYELQRLRRDGLIERDGLRVELGTATGGSARNKADVLFIPTSPSDGQYHLSIRFASR